MLFCILIRGGDGEVIGPAAMFVYITWPWRHFRRYTWPLTTMVTEDGQVGIP